MPGNRSIQSVQRAVQILYAVAGAEEGRTIGQISATLGIKTNTAYRFIRSLEEEKLLTRRRGPLRLVLGPAIAELKRFDDDRHLLSLSVGVMARGHSRLPEANLALLERDGVDVHQRLYFRPGHPGRVERRRLYVVHPYSKASSLVFLAYSQPDEVEAFFHRHPFEKEARKFWRSRRELEDFLVRVRRLGRAEPDFEDENWFRLAVPIFSPGGEVIASLAGYISRNHPKALQKELALLCVRMGKEITRKFAEEKP